MPAFANQQTQVVWRRRPPSLRPALRKIEDVLVEYTVRWARDHWPDEPVYCLGQCAVAPALTVDDRLWVRVTPDEVAEILDQATQETL